MQFQKVTDGFSLSGQISPEDVPRIKEAGFKTIMCNRPDGESADQPSADVIRAAAKEIGLKFCFVPMSPSGLGPTTLEDFRAVVSGENDPVFAYCRTGNRCGMLWNAVKG